MGQFFFKLDQSLIGLATRISHSWQRLTGLTNFWIARVLGLGLVLMAPLLLLDTTLRINKENAISTSLGTILYAILTLAFLLNFQMSSRQFREMEDYYLSGNTVAHRRTLAWRQLWRYRMTGLVNNSVVFLMFGWAVHGRIPSVFWILFTGAWTTEAADFFSVVIPLPPGNSKIRKLLDNWSIFWTPSMATQTQ